MHWEISAHGISGAGPAAADVACVKCGALRLRGFSVSSVCSVGPWIELV